MQKATVGETPVVGQHSRRGGSSSNSQPMEEAAAAATTRAAAYTVCAQKDEAARAQACLLFVLECCPWPAPTADWSMQKRRQQQQQQEQPRIRCVLRTTPNG